MQASHPVARIAPRPAHSPREVGCKVVQSSLLPVSAHSSPECLTCPLGVSSVSPSSISRGWDTSLRSSPAICALLLAPSAPRLTLSSCGPRSSSPRGGAFVPHRCREHFSLGEIRCGMGDSAGRGQRVRAARRHASARTGRAHRARTRCRGALKCAREGYSVGTYCKKSVRGWRAAKPVPRHARSSTAAIRPEAWCCRCSNT